MEAAGTVKARIALSCVLLAAVAIPVDAAPGQTQHSISGSCYFEGTAAYPRPLTNRPQGHTYDFAGSGDCTGTIDRVSIGNVTMDLRVSGPFTGSCGNARSTAPDPGR